jgi:hypothetical protein
MQTQEIMNAICDAHQKGQTFAGYKHPSWSEAFAYWKSVEEKFTSTNKQSTQSTGYECGVECPCACHSR